MTWYEKCYGVPPPVKEKPTVILNTLPKVLKEEKKQIKEAAWYRAKHDYMEYLRKRGKEGININAI